MKDRVLQSIESVAQPPQPTIAFQWIRAQLQMEIVRKGDVVHQGAQLVGVQEELLKAAQVRNDGHVDMLQAIERNVEVL